MSNEFDVLTTGNCAWIQKNNFMNPFIYSDKFNWFIVNENIMSKKQVKEITRPIVMNFGYAVTTEHVQKTIDKYRDRIIGVIWDYEGGYSQERSELELMEVHLHCQDCNLPFGVCVLQGSENSLANNGVAYERAHLFCDFLAPMIYCQWWNKDPKLTRAIYSACVEQSYTVPMVMVVNLQTTMAPIENPIMSIPELFRNYFELEPRPYRIIWYGLKILSEEYLWAIDFIGSEKYYNDN